MFWLPVDFLLGRVQDPVGGNIHEWIQEHQTRLQLAFEGAAERSWVVAERRKNHHDRRVRELPLMVGQLVWFRDFRARGRPKLRDLYGPVQYRVLKVPREGGPVYTIAPVDEPTKARQVNRALLKPVVEARPLSEAASPCSPPADPPQSEDELSGDDLFILRHEAPLVTPTRVTATQPAPRLQLLPAPLAPTGQVPLGPSTRAPEGPIPSSPPLPRLLPAVSEVAIRRTVRSTAGQHSNVYHLPRPVVAAENAAEPPGPVSNAVMALFRPWS
ncbi:hypothetical protein DPEC_G00342450 [Dallia pectoralis]|uniref:Uncharacterized protein n=1 Tax=Dallia pectoralis TaxID=75939 RepID=A0ACC2F5P1_DALPE|nr:hypothetical protein DPEC_G00342450 [Dallia pectoralis]